MLHDANPTGIGQMEDQTEQDEKDEMGECVGRRERNKK
jgi:hypothetical protein